MSSVELNKDDLEVLKNMFIYLRDKCGLSEEEKTLISKLYKMSYKVLK
jgi:hypothetical protein